MTRNGAIVSLFGGHIHATHRVTWDILGPQGEFDDERFPYGLQGLPTLELMRAIRTL